MDITDIVAEDTEKRIAPYALGLAICAMAVEGNPIHRLAMFILPIAVSDMVTHMNPIVVGLRETDGDGFQQAERVVQPARPKIGRMDEVVGDPVDVP